MITPSRRGHTTQRRYADLPAYTMTAIHAEPDPAGYEHDHGPRPTSSLLRAGRAVSPGWWTMW